MLPRTVNATWEPERVVELRDDAAGLRAFVVIDSTRRGPAFGGIRRARYADVAAARADACALAQAMTLKCALAGLPAGGAKTVLVDHDGLDRARSYAAIADAIEALGGAYVAGPDVGTGAAELAVVRARTVHCNPARNDASAATAAGVLAALRAVWPVLGGTSPKGARAIVQGLGGVGSIVARELVALGVDVVACDPDEEACRRARAHGIGIVAVADALVHAADVLVPCALGGILDETRARSVPVRAVCGSANNQLIGDAARVLGERGIVHVPDIVASAGAVIEGVLIVQGGDAPHVRARVQASIAAIETTAARLLAAAREQGRAAETIAHEWARAAVQPASPLVQPVIVRAAPRRPTGAAARLLAEVADALADDREEKIACCRVIARLLAADGAIDDTERAFLASTMQRHGLATSDLERVLERVLAGAGTLDDDLAAIGPSARTELVRYLEAAAALDGRLAPEEAAILERVRPRSA